MKCHILKKINYISLHKSIIFSLCQIYVFKGGETDTFDSSSFCYIRLLSSFSILSPQISFTFMPLMFLPKSAFRLFTELHFTLQYITIIHLVDAFIQSNLQLWWEEESLKMHICSDVMNSFYIMTHLLWQQYKTLLAFAHNFKLDIILNI